MTTSYVLRCVTPAGPWLKANYVNPLDPSNNDPTTNWVKAASMDNKAAENLIAYLCARHQGLLLKKVRLVPEDLWQEPTTDWATQFSNSTDLIKELGELRVVTRYAHKHWANGAPCIVIKLTEEELHRVQAACFIIWTLSLVEKIFLEIIEVGVLEDRLEYVEDDLRLAYPDLSPAEVTQLYDRIQSNV